MNNPNDLHENLRLSEMLIHINNQAEELKSTPMPKPLTDGQKLVGIKFNPSGDPGVNRAKQLCAELADMLYTDRDTREAAAPIGSTGSELYYELHTHAIGAILNAQMNAVKVLTLAF